MMERILWSLAPAIVCASVATAQDEEVRDVEVRVTSEQPGGIVRVDRGMDALIEIGDLVTFRPRDGGVYEGAVIEVEDRSALVELLDPGFVPSVGTRGSIGIPLERIRSERGGPAEVARTKPWEYTDDAWKPGMPLLAGEDTVQPADRRPLFFGRTYLWLNQIETTENDRGDAFYRAGTDLVYENPFGRGGTLNIDTELNYRSTEVPDRIGQYGTRLRFDRASYQWGGTRFDPVRQEAGRFLQYGMPEFGVLDGYEYNQRLENGDTWGASVGWMPEPDYRFRTGRDFQIAGFYKWQPLDRDNLSLSAGYQRSWHNGAQDRDLVIGKVHYRTASNWDLHSTAWFDLYSDADTKPFLELTHLLATAQKTYGDEGSIRYTYRHLAFPELDRNEFLPVAVDQLADDFSERLSVSGWKRLSEKRRFNGRAGVWVDEDQVGGDLQGGMSFEDFWLARSRTDVNLFVSAGAFSVVYGARTGLTRYVEGGSWNVLYELQRQQNEDFDIDGTYLIQHWVRASRDWHTQSGWDVNLAGETLAWDDEFSWRLALYVQKGF